MGTVPVATAVLNDLIGLLDPGQSWTGRYPRAQDRLAAPSFDMFLTLSGRRAVIGSRELPGSIPVLEATPG